jgi:hypothetical protein
VLFNEIVSYTAGHVSLSFTRGATRTTRCFTTATGFGPSSARGFPVSNASTRRSA